MPGMELYSGSGIFGTEDALDQGGAPASSTEPVVQRAPNTRYFEAALHIHMQQSAARQDAAQRVPNIGAIETTAHRDNIRAPNPESSRPQFSWAALSALIWPPASELSASMLHSPATDPRPGGVEDPVTADTSNRGLNNSEAPEFSPQCHGGPLEWNCEEGVAYWNKHTWKSFNTESKGLPSINVILDFLHKRQGPSGEAILDLFGEPEKKRGIDCVGCEPHDTWYRLPWLAGQEGQLHPGWQRAWHGCKFEAVYSIAYQGQLKESIDHSIDSNGGRALEGAPGVYLHKDATARKAAGSYSRWSPLFKDGHLWIAKWEAVVDRDDIITTLSRTDQWVQPARSVQLIALWVCGRTAEQMINGDEMALKWDPQMEANPFA